MVGFTLRAFSGKAFMSSKPNILLILADDHRHTAMGHTGMENVQTPCMDWLAETGVRFLHNRHTGSHCGAVCIPARASLHTGQPATVAMRDYESDGLPTGAVINGAGRLLGETLGAAGYATFITGKWHNDTASLNRSFSSGENIFFGGMEDHFKTPVCDYDPSGRYENKRVRVGSNHSSEMFADAAIRLIESQDGRSPFFAYVAFTSPHDPRTAPKQFHDMYPPEQVELPPNTMPSHPFDLGDFRIRDELLAGFPRSEDELHGHISDYYAMITHQDQQMQRIVNALERCGQLDNTVVIYTADHGLALGQHGLMGKQNLYDHSTRVPLIIRGPGLPSLTVRHSMTHTMDVFPTLCDLVGIAKPKNIAAQSLVPLIESSDYVHREHATCFYRRFQRSVTDGRYKLIVYHASAGEGSERQQCFDLKNDPWEMNDLISDPASQSVIEKLRAQLPARFPEGSEALSGLRDHSRQ